VVPYTSGKIWSARLIFLFFFVGSVLEYIHCNKYQNFNKFQPTDSELLIHWPHSSFSLCGFDHRDAWHLHTNIIWSKRSTDFKELSPLSEKEEIEDTKVVIRSRKLMKDRQYNGQKNIGQTVIYKQPHRKLNIEVILCSGRMSSSCSTRNIRHITVKQH
jgi:hypothetical protein